MKKTGKKFIDTFFTTLEIVMAIAGIVIILYLIHYTLTTPFRTKPDVRVGQTWEYKYTPEDPFKEDIYYKQEIIDVKGDYLLYTQNRDTLSKHKSLFLASGSECIKNCE